MAARRLRHGALALAAAAALTASAGAAEAALRVYFGFDRAELTREGAAVAREFAAGYDPAQVSRIVVVGHADRAGDPLYNEELSLLRAEAVAEELKRLGVAPAIVAVQAKGESEPAVPTQDGVAERLNRRAEIVWLK